MIWYVAIGSALGGVSRYLLGGLIQRWSGASFPVGTLVINVSGSFLLAAINTYALATTAIPVEVRALLTIGFCGGYTTFSTFSYETMSQLQDGLWSRATLYVVLSVTLSLAGAVGGIGAARELLRLKEQF